MKNHPSVKLLIALLLLLVSLNFPAHSAPAALGDKAPDFSLKTLDDKTVRLGDLTAQSNVVLIVLRGWPGYQCPICTVQVHDYSMAATNFSGAKAQVVMVYPGPADALKEHAQDFLKNKQWPANFLFVVDPDYTMVDAYGLRWNAPKETAYPSTFVIDKKGIIRFAKSSHKHGDRTKPSDVLPTVTKMAGE